MTERKPVAPFYAAAVVFLLYALIFPLYAPLHYAIAAAAAAAVFAVASLLCRGGARRRRRKKRRRSPPATRSWTRCSKTAGWPSPR